MTLTNDYEILCDYYDCMFCSDGQCYGGLYQCPHIKERAALRFPLAKEAYIDYFKWHSKDEGEEFYMDAESLRTNIREYAKILGVPWDELEEFFNSVQ